MIAINQLAMPKVKPRNTLSVSWAQWTVLLIENRIAATKPNSMDNVPCSIATELGFMPTTRTVSSDFFVTIKPSLLVTIYIIHTMVLLCYSFRIEFYYNMR